MIDTRIQALDRVRRLLSSSNTTGKDSTDVRGQFQKLSAGLIKVVNRSSLSFLRWLNNESSHGNSKIPRQDIVSSSAVQRDSLVPPDVVTLRETTSKILNLFTSNARQKGADVTLSPSSEVDGLFTVILRRANGGPATYAKLRVIGGPQFIESYSFESHRESLFLNVPSHLSDDTWYHLNNLAGSIVGFMMEDLDMGHDKPFLSFESSDHKSFRFSEGKDFCPVLTNTAVAVDARSPIGRFLEDDAYGCSNYEKTDIPKTSRLLKTYLLQHPDLWRGDADLGFEEACDLDHLAPEQAMTLVSKTVVHMFDYNLAQSAVKRVPRMEWFEDSLIDKMFPSYTIKEKYLAALPPDRQADIRKNPGKYYAERMKIDATGADVFLEQKMQRERNGDNSPVLFVCRNYAAITKAFTEAVKLWQDPENNHLRNFHCIQTGSGSTNDVSPYVPGMRNLEGQQLRGEHAWNTFVCLSEGGNAKVVNVDLTWGDGGAKLEQDRAFVTQSRMAFTLNKMVKAGLIGEKDLEKINGILPDSPETHVTRSFIWHHFLAQASGVESGKSRREDPSSPKGTVESEHRDSLSRGSPKKTIDEMFRSHRETKVAKAAECAREVYLHTQSNVAAILLVYNSLVGGLSLHIIDGKNLADSVMKLFQGAPSLRKKYRKEYDRIVNIRKLRVV
ncbi:MAG: hypothetical protein WCG83_02560 [Candidatus Peregrinibacteria bacterium]